MAKADQIFSTEYRNTENWKLVNDYTIYEGKEDATRKFMQTRVPKHLWLNLKDVRAIDAYEWDAFWTGNLSVEEDGSLAPADSDEPRVSKYVHKRRITARAALEDKITLFDIPGGALFQFQKIAHVAIIPFHRNTLGGKTRRPNPTGSGSQG